MESFLVSLNVEGPLIRWQGRSMAVPLPRLLPIKGNKATDEAIADWLYWVAQGYCF